ncbi:DNA-directed DNA polymerase, family X [mine drainage metagenome]|uniref:DNA-directed DNA polymerase n=1 Tax=mine drainage metagenome TaxID=410659 RepID=T0YEC5_9ZZZZ
MANEEIARIFYEIADLLDLEGVRFKPEAYRRAARTLEQLPSEVRTLKDPQAIRALPGIGEALSLKIEEYRETGKVPYLDRLREKWPPGLLEIMRLEGVGPKTTRRFHQELGIADLAGLKAALEAGQLDHLAGFKARKVELLRRALSQAGTVGLPSGGGRRIPLPEAQRMADELMAAFRASGVPVDRLVYAGSLRRRREDVGDLDLLATTRGDPRSVMEAFLHLPPVREVRLSGETKTTVVLDGGLQVDLRVVAPEAFGAAWQYFTGSKDHNIRLRTLAQQKGWKINEYGLSRGEERTAAPTEEAVYAAVGFPWIPPEIRENQGEFEAALEGASPGRSSLGTSGGSSTSMPPPPSGRGTSTPGSGRPGARSSGTWGSSSGPRTWPRARSGWRGSAGACRGWWEGSGSSSRWRPPSAAQRRGRGRSGPGPTCGSPGREGPGGPCPRPLARGSAGPGPICSSTPRMDPSRRRV